MSHHPAAVGWEDTSQVHQLWTRLLDLISATHSRLASLAPWEGRANTPSQPVSQQHRARGIHTPWHMRQLQEIQWFKLRFLFQLLLPLLPRMEGTNGRCDVPAEATSVRDSCCLGTEQPRQSKILRHHWTASCIVLVSKETKDSFLKITSTTKSNC